MAAKEPIGEPMRTTSEASAKPWAEVLSLFQEGSTSWLATTRPDGRPHVRPVGPIVVDGAFYFTTGQGTVKGENIAHNAQCALCVAVPGFDLVIEGVAAQVSDAPAMQRLAAAYAAQGWPATAGDGALDAPFAAPTTGPAPYTVYEMTPTMAYAFATNQSTMNQLTRYRF
jgi:hypothetical protein